MDRGPVRASTLIHLNIKPVIVCVAKQEKDYIYEWMDYHFKLGFGHIYLYDNEDNPTYENMLRPYFDESKLTVFHIPGGVPQHGMPIQYVILRHFMRSYINNKNVTHACHIDIDEFICLKKHNNIKEFIKEYLKTDTNNVPCSCISMSWRFFGSSGKTKKTNEPVTQRFTMCERDCEKRIIKDIYYVKDVTGYETVHSVFTKTYPRQLTNGEIVHGAVTKTTDYSVIQLNHYKTKTWEEFVNIRKRGWADRVNVPEDVKASFKEHDFNEIEDLTARDFYKRKLEEDKENIKEVTNKKENTGIIILRHVSKKSHNDLWNLCYKCVRKVYPNIEIVIIDDNSNDECIENDVELTNTRIIKSEYPGKGEILPYYYMYKEKLFDKALILHDSCFIQKYINLNDITKDVTFIWFAQHCYDEIAVNNGRVEGMNREMIKYLNNADKLLDFYDTRKTDKVDRKWLLCFGAMSIIKLEFINRLQEKHNLFNIMKYLTTRHNRMEFERVFGLICCYEDPSIIKYNESEDEIGLNGNIHEYLKTNNLWRYCGENGFDTIKNDMKNGEVPSNINMLKLIGHSR